MDQLENKIRAAFEQIPFAEGNLLDQDVVYSLELDGSKASVVLIIPQEEESFIQSIANAVENALTSLEEITEVSITVVDTKEEAEAADQPHAHHHHQHQHAAPPQSVSYLGDYENVVLVASGKGGVGKSTTAINLALALKKLGKSVSLLDADIYGPSVPVMMGSRGEMPEIIQNQIQPMSRFGVEYMSIGNLVAEEDSMIWRGPMVHQVLQQLLRDTTWPGGDYMIIDMPPGTGDVQISLAQMTQAAGAVIVSTPQDVALLDARKAIQMFNKVEIPILGIVENMSFFKCPNCGEETAIFSTGGAQGEAKQQETEFLGRIPIELRIRLGSDQGKPVVEAYPESPEAQTYLAIAKKLDQILNEA